ncbi:MAG: type II toxin-antitoxin system PemK/MazF family toxin [Armatimonadota bacterium]
MTKGLKRGDIVKVRLDPAEGSEQGGERPAVVISPDFINDRSPVIIVAAITSRKTDRIFPLDVLIEPPDSGLATRSKAMLTQIRTIDASRVTGSYGTLSPATIAAIDEALKIALGLEPL